ncbi:hypothetical protein [Streptomyces sp. NK08204]|uniref:hypothetical protein n=1 Tax=Streptomyces sp. NK08204 TaxID=2873260 RepID=UPI001CEDDF83|nr:hypothetical protein [Streptomyces sp. NK08204]
MGERLSGDGFPGRRRVHPGGAVSGPADVADAAALETVLAAAIRVGDLDPQAEQRAVAAFRAARAAGPHRARTRRRDDWRPPAQRRARHTVRTTFGVVFATLTLGGVAVAAIGSAGSSADGGDAGRATGHPSALAPDRPGGVASPATSGGPRPTDGPAPAQDTEAHCRAYEQVEGRGRALDAAVWQQLVAAAGGRAKVAAYCSEQLTRATATPGRPESGTGRPSDGATPPVDVTPAGTGAAGSTAGNAGDGAANGTPAGTPGATADAGGSGQASGGQGSGRHR